MGKIIQIEIPEGLEEKFVEKFEKAVRMLEIIVFSEILKDILEKSELTEEEAEKISEEIKEEVLKRYEDHIGH